MSVNFAHTPNLVGGTKGVFSGRRGEFDTFSAFLFVVPRAALKRTLKSMTQRPMTKIRVSVLGIFILGQLVSGFYRNSILLQKTLFLGPASYLR